MHDITLSGGDRLRVRPIRPDDKQRLLEGFERLSPESRYRRFLSPVRSLGTRELRYLTEVDHHNHDALVAIDPRTDELVGVARFIRSTADATVAEVAVAVVDDWQGRGVGSALSHALAGRAREEGVERISAFVLAENHPMLAVFRGLGDVHVRGTDHGVVELVMTYRPKASLTRSRTRSAPLRGARSTPGILWSKPDPPLAKWHPWVERLRLSQPAWR